MHGWWRDGEDECLELGGGRARDWSFFWPGRVVVEPLFEGLVWTAHDGARPVPPGSTLVAMPNAAHLRFHLAAGSRARVRFAPAADVTPTLGQVFLPEVVVVGDDPVPGTRVFVPRYVALAYQRLVETKGQIKLHELADRVGVARCHLCRTYQRTIGLPPYRHRQHLRIARGRALLRAGLDCGRVAHLVGFCDQSHFTRSFKELTGTRPSAYARLFQDAGHDERRPDAANDRVSCCAFKASNTQSAKALVFAGSARDAW